MRPASELPKTPKTLNRHAMQCVADYGATRLLAAILADIRLFEPSFENLEKAEKLIDSLQRILAPREQKNGKG